MIEASHWKDLETAAPCQAVWRWRHFSPKEMAERSAGWNEGLSPIRVDAFFLDRLERLREAFGEPLMVISGYRSPDYNAKVSRTGRSGPHTTGCAADIRIGGQAARRLVKLAVEHGFTGIGLQQKGPLGRRFVHLDDLEDDGKRPRPWIWTY